VPSTTEERALFRADVRRALQRLSPESAVRALIDNSTGHDPAVWHRLASELGLPGLLVPEQFGGQGTGVGEIVVAIEESARGLLCAPLLTTALATLALLRCPDGEERSALLTGIAEGGTLVTVASAGGRVSASGGDGAGWLIASAAVRVVDGHLADRILVEAPVAGRIALFAVDAHDPGVTVEPLESLDPTRRHAAVTAAAVPATMLARDFAAASADVLDTAALLASAELTAVAARALELTVEHVRGRRQFGRRIGSFQAVKHLVADSMVGVEQMQAVVDSAVRLAEGKRGSDAERAELVSVVKAYCSETGPAVVETLIQVLGGIGFTWEHPAHLYLRRAKSLATMYGSARWHRERLAQLLDLALPPDETASRPVVAAAGSTR
jgi:alkylation response protein AidB-like acyl-CoA dehydrogenase